LIAKGLAEPVLYVGNLMTARDFIDVRDGVAAMMLLLERGTPGQAVNICSGKAYKIDEVLRMLIEISGVNVKIVEDKSLLRASDEPLLLGNNQKIKDLGFVQKYTLFDTLRGVYQDWINRCEG
jgi:GDP-4-dehydro-6-deoxy-D-mannose reductase